MSFVTTAHSFQQPRWVRQCLNISRWLLKTLLSTVHQCLCHWKILLLIISLSLPLLFVSWVFVGLSVSKEERGIRFYLHWNTPQQSFLRLAQLVNLPLEETNSTAYLRTLADATAQRHGIDPGLFRALITQESAWNPNAVSPRGAAGLTQLMPATALQSCGLQAAERFDAAKNLDCGAKYFAHQLRRFKSVDLALAAYNAGPTRVAKLGRIPRIAETENYVTRILANWQGAG